MKNTEKIEITKKDVTKNIILFVVGAAAIVGGSQLLKKTVDFCTVHKTAPRKNLKVT